MARPRHELEDIVLPGRQASQDRGLGTSVQDLDVFASSPSVHRPAEGVRQAVSLKAASGTEPAQVCQP
jgi:hypothetical protein